MAATEPNRRTGALAVLHGALREPGVGDTRHYARRVTRLAAVHAALLVAALAGAIMILWCGELFVTLAQRSNVETLTIAFFLVLFGYFTFITAPGARGAVRIARFRLARRFSKNRAKLDARRLRALGKRRDGATVAFDKAIALANHAGAWEVELRDDLGSLGRLRFDGVRLQHLDTFRNGSNTLLGYVEQRLGELARADLAIVEWASIDDEAYRKFAAAADAMRATWPTVTLSEAARDALEEELAGLCEALRDELLLPDWEFSGEHKLPIIAEPLGIISLKRSEQRVDPLSSMTTALGVILAVDAVIAYFIASPPWIPGR